MVPQSSAVLDSMSLLLVVLAMKALITPQGVSSHFVWPFEIWLVLQDLMHWFSEQSVNCLGSRRPRLSSKIPLGFIIVVAIRLKIPPLLRDNLTFLLSLLLVFLHSLVFINAVHESMHAFYRLLRQEFSQIMLCV